MRLFLLAVAAAVALPLSAATRYTVNMEPNSATVLIDGPRRRIEFLHRPMPFEYDVLLSDDAGKTFIALNTPLKTWFRLGENVPSNAIPVLYGSAIMHKYSVRDVKVMPSDEPAEAIDGVATHKFVVKTSFRLREDYSGTPVDSQISSTLLVWTTDAVDPALAWKTPALAKTDVPDVDAQLAPVLEKIAGFPLKIVFTATRAYQQSRPQTHTMTITVSDIRTVDAPPHAFERPADYVHQAPIIGAPGRN
jgi:hypothetical protein